MLKRLLIGTIVLFLGWHGFRAARAAGYEYLVFHGPRSTPTRPIDAGQLGLVDAEFPSAGGRNIRGWYLPSATGASVVLAAGSSSDRVMMLPHARLLHASGLGVLLFDWPGTGTSDGDVRLGAPERAALSAAVNYVATRPDVVDGRIGLLGFSLGAHAGAIVAADDSRVRAVVLEGIFTTTWEQALTEYRSAGRAAQWGAVLMDYLSGMERGGPDVRDAIAKLAPRPVLFVAGTADHVVPASVSRTLFGFAGEPKQFMEITGAGHGTYLSSDPTYATRLQTFFLGALRAEPREKIDPPTTNEAASPTRNRATTAAP